MGVARVAGVKREGEAGILQRAGMLKTGTFHPLISLFLPPRAPLTLSRAQFSRSPSPFKAATQATLSGLSPSNVKWFLKGCGCVHWRAPHTNCKQM